MKIALIKCHGSRNDFIMIDETVQLSGYNNSIRSLIARHLCNRQTAIGADGVLFYQNDKVFDARMQMFNPDGSEAEMCGNGIRCIIRLAFHKTRSKNIAITTMHNVYKGKEESELYAGVPAYSVDIHSIALESAGSVIDNKGQKIIDQYIPQISLNARFTAVNVSNPHLVALLNNFDDEELISTGQRANKMKSLFPNGINVSFVKVLENRNIYVRTYERGAGLTKACGTAMCAASMVCTGKFPDWMGHKIDVYNKGGMVRCIVKKNSDIYYTVNLCGNATFEYCCTIEWNPEDPLSIKILDKKLFVEEVNAYEDFFRSLPHDRIDI